MECWCRTCFIVRSKTGAGSGDVVNFYAQSSSLIDIPDTPSDSTNASCWVSLKKSMDTMKQKFVRQCSTSATTKASADLDNLPEDATTLIEKVFMKTMPPIPSDKRVISEDDQILGVNAEELVNKIESVHLRLRYCQFIFFSSLWRAV